MKKQIFSICSAVILLIAGVTMTGCNTNNPTQPSVAQVYHVSIQAGKGDANPQNGPRRALGLTTENEKEILTASWAEGEQVTVRNVTKEADLGGYLEAEGNGVQTMISGDLTGTINAGDILELKFLSPNYTNQLGTLAYIEANCDYAVATIHVASVTYGSITFDEGIADFQNQQAIVKFTLKNEAKTANLSASKLVVEVNGASYTVTPESATNELFVALPGFSDQTVKLTATVGSETYTFTSPTNGVSFANGEYHTVTVGLSKGFSIDATHQIAFAKGNLQYKDSEHKWRIATNQYDFVGSYMEVHAFGNGLWFDYPAIGNVYEGGNKCNNADPYTDVMSTNCWIDLFGWNTWDKPLLISDNMADYATGQSSFTDWGANEIYDGDVKRPANYWRTLTNDEWNYILNGRDNADHLCGTASITSDYGDVKGLILLPDGFVKPDDITFHYITDSTSNYPMALSPNKDYSGASGYPNMILTLNPKTDENFHSTLANALNADNYVYNQNRYTKSQWKKMEDAGAVFLPVAGWMQVRYVDKDDPSKGVWALHRFANFVGGYWSSSLSSSEAFYLMLTHEEGKVGFGTQPFCNGQAVRLVHNLY